MHKLSTCHHIMRLDDISYSNIDYRIPISNHVIQYFRIKESETNRNCEMISSESESAKTLIVNVRITRWHEQQIV